MICITKTLWINQTAQAMASASFRLINGGTTTTLLLLLLITVVVSVSGHDHIVGASKGWNPGINYTSWINDQTFYVGDLISFRYNKHEYNVFEVNETGYEKCSIEGAMGNWSGGKDFIPLHNAQRYYFICVVNGGCFNGMKVSVLVHPLPPPPQQSQPAPPTAAHSAAARGAPFSAVVMALLPSMWVGFKWAF